MAKRDKGTFDMRGHRLKWSALLPSPRDHQGSCWPGVLVGMLAVLTLTGCQPTASAPQPDQASPPAVPSDVTPPRAQQAAEVERTFVDHTAGSGIDFTYLNGEEAGHVSILESLGGGVACFDFDKDGREDLCFAGGGEFTTDEQILGKPSGLYRNLGGWSFARMAAPAFVDPAQHYSHGIIAADYDSDGFGDFVVTGYGGLQLFHNLGDGSFEECIGQSGLNDPLWSSSAAWADFNGDSHLDLVVVHYVNWSFENHPFCPGPAPGQRDICPPRKFDGLPDTLFLSNGDGTFTDATAAGKLRSDGKGLGVLAADFDADGHIDLYVTNDTVPNHLYRNQGQAVFEDVSLVSGASLSNRGLPDGSMGTDGLDFNADGLLDIWVVNYENESPALYQNEEDFSFRHVSGPTGVTAGGGMYVGWGTCCFDYDHDADEDIFVSNGHVIRFPKNAPLRQTPLLMKHVEGHVFRKVVPEPGYLEEPHMGRGSAGGDIDGDGDIDLAVSHTNEPAVVLENVAKSLGRWISLELVGVQSPRDSVGAIVTLKSPTGRQCRHWKGGASYASTNTRAIHFGLGENDAPVNVTIQWPSGQRQEIAALTPGQVHRIVEASQQPVLQ